MYEFSIAADVTSVLRPNNPGARPACLALLPPDVDPAKRLAELKRKSAPPVLPTGYREEYASSPDGDNDDDLFDLLDCRELARQITAVDHALFCEISRVDFLSIDLREQQQLGGTAAARGVNETALGDNGDQHGGRLGWLLGERATRFQNWVSSCVVRAAEPVVALREWIHVADHCMRLNNLNGLVGVVRGLGHVSTTHAWNHLQSIAADKSNEGATEALKAQADSDLFLDLQSKCSADDNFSCISGLARQSTLPCDNPFSRCCIAASRFAWLKVQTARK